METFDIFISYKRKSLNFANNLYYRLTQRGYSVFFDLEEMRRDRFDEQLYRYIEAASDVFVVLEEGSLEACKKDDWNQDWFCREIYHALEKKKNIIPILLDDFKMPPVSYFPDELKGLPMIEAKKFDIVYFDQYLDSLEKKEFLVSKPRLNNQESSVFKLYSNRDTEIFKDGKLVGCLTGGAEEPFYIPVPRKGSYRFKGIDVLTKMERIEKCQIEANAEEEVEFIWEMAPEIGPSEPEVEENGQGEADNDHSDDSCVRVITVGDLSFSMVYVDGGLCGNERIKPFYIGQFPVTQNIWKQVMGDNPSANPESNETMRKRDLRRTALAAGTVVSTLLMPMATLPVIALSKFLKQKKTDEIGHYPVEMVNNFEAVRFVKRLSEMTGLSFDLPTEMEWSYAAKGGKETRGFRFAGSDSIDDVAWYDENSGGCTHPVGEKNPNELGLFDMSGNVWEWTHPASSRYGVRMGGSWSRQAVDCEVIHRDCLAHSKRTSASGLRVVLHDLPISGKV